MRCRDVLRLSTRYVDGDLDERRSSAVRGHLRTCEGCNRAVEEEARVRDAASALDAPIDPPASLWAGVQAELAREEIADSSRSRLWLLWPRVRAQLPYLGAAAAAAVALTLWLSDRAGDRELLAGGGEPSVSVQKTTIRSGDHRSGEPGEAAARESHQQRALRQVREADVRYLTTIAELRAVAASERVHWSEAKAAAVDARLMALDAAKLAQRKRLAAGGGAGPASRRELYGLYQEEIGLLTRASVGELEEELR